MDELQRLQAAINTIHNHLHAGDVDAAHRACECAIQGDEVRQPNLTLSQTTRIHIFSGKFNALCDELQIPAAYVALLPSATVREKVSMQLGGAVTVCKIVEQAFGARSTYQGDDSGESQAGS